MEGRHEIGFFCQKSCCLNKKSVEKTGGFDFFSPKNICGDFLPASSWFTVQIHLPSKGVSFAAPKVKTLTALPAELLSFK